MEEGSLVKRNKINNTVIIVSFIFIISISYFFIQMNKLINFYEDKAYPGQFLENQNIDGYTKNEINKLINDLELDYLENNIIINTKDNKFINKGKDIDLEAINKNSIVEKTMNFYKDKNYISKALFLCKNTLFPIKKWSETYNLELDYNEELLTKHIKAIKDDVDVVKTEPTLDMKVYGEFEIIDGKEGYSVNIEKTLSEFEKNIKKIKNDSLEINIIAEVEKITIDKSIFENVDSKISSYTTSYSTGSGRARNVELGAERVNKTVLLPGEEFSLNKTVLPRTRENGYKGAPEYRNGKVIQGIGGGICQVSTTMYGAQLRAGILPTERFAHSMTVAYAPIGLDAAIAGDTADLKFVNTYEYPIYINSYTGNGKITMEFWSNKNATNGIRYEPKSYKRTSLKADAYLYGYDSENKEVYKKYLGQSNYRPHPKKEESND